MKKNYDCHVQIFILKGGLYQKTGWANFDELQVTNSTLNEGINSRVLSELGQERWFVRHCHTNKHHKTRNQEFRSTIVNGYKRPQL